MDTLLPPIITLLLLFAIGLDIFIGWMTPGGKDDADTNGGGRMKDEAGWDPHSYGMSAHRWVGRRAWRNGISWEDQARPGFDESRPEEMLRLYGQNACATHDGGDALSEGEGGWKDEG